jgi:hypothetical protein
MRNVETPRHILGRHGKPLSRSISSHSHSQHTLLTPKKKNQGSAHARFATSSQHLKQVVEVIDTARDNLDLDKLERQAGIIDADSSDSDLSSDDDEKDMTMLGRNSESPSSRRDRRSLSRSSQLPDGSVGDKQSVMDQMRDYKRRAKTLHRQHRGIMQWKVSKEAFYKVPKGQKKKKKLMPC